MKVFISWSGTESRTIAEALRGWLPVLFGEIDPYMSARDNEPGVRWANVISSELEGTDFGILCLTPKNLEAPWLLFEAGALSKSVEVARVVPLLWRLTTAEVTSPLSQFHMKTLNEDGIREIVQSINKLLPTPRSDEALGKAFTALWPALESEIDQVHNTVDLVKTPRPQRQILEEILQLVRNTNQTLPRHERDLSALIEMNVIRERDFKRWQLVLGKILDGLADVERVGDAIVVTPLEPVSYRRTFTSVSPFVAAIRADGLRLKVLEPGQSAEDARDAVVI